MITTVSRAGLAGRRASRRRWASSRVAPARVSTSNRPAAPGASGRMTWLPAASTSRAKGSDAVVPSGGMAIRARGRRVIDGGPDLLFYTNAVQVR